MIQARIRFVRERYGSDGPVALHEPVFAGNERRYVLDTIDTTFVSSVGAYVDRFERDVAAYTGAAAAVATVNGTAALHVALRLCGVLPGDFVITQPLTFVATCNAIAYCGATPVFVDVEQATLGLSPTALAAFLDQWAERREDGCVHRPSGRPLRACVPMHTFGHPADTDGIAKVCAHWGIALIEDAAESLGSRRGERHTGLAGRLGVVSFNGNKIVTTGGGGMIITNDLELARHAKHLTTTAKVPHAYEYAHDELGYNYRMPNINAALGCAQLERLDEFVVAKRALAAAYRDFLADSDWQFVVEPAGCRSNYWLNAALCRDRSERDRLLAETNAQRVMTRPVWQLANRLPMYAACPSGPLDTAEWLADRIVNLPSSVPRQHD